jgi:hypothetical protein
MAIAARIGPEGDKRMYSLKKTAIVGSAMAIDIS